MSIQNSLNYIANSKYKFKKSWIKCLGHKISDSMVSVDPAKTEAINTWPEPPCVCDLQLFIGLANYYNKFTPNFTTITAPLTDLLSTGN